MHEAVAVLDGATVVRILGGLQNLVDAANEAGGPDNITVAMLQVDVA